MGSLERDRPGPGFPIMTLAPLFVVCRGVVIGAGHLKGFQMGGGASVVVVVGHSTAELAFRAKMAVRGM